MTDSLKLELRPAWDEVKRAWKSCMDFFKAQGLSQDACYALSMTAQELLENAVKYGAYEDPGQSIALRVATTPRHVTVEVKNPTRADGAALRALDETIQWIRGFQNPFEAYVEKLKLVSSQPFEAGQSGLGLARAAYEGQCVLDFYVNDQDLLSVSAVFER